MKKTHLLTLPSKTVYPKWAKLKSMGSKLKSARQSYKVQGAKLHCIKDAYLIDDGISGTTFERPSFLKMIEAAKKKQFDCIVVKDLSRLGRNYIETGRYLERIFPTLGVRFIAVLDNYDSSKNDESGQLLIAFKNIFNDAYCRA